MTTYEEQKLATASATSAASFSLMDGLHSIVKFSGDDKTYSSSKWAQDIEDNAEIFQWTPQQTLIIARRTLSGTAALWLRSEKTFKTYEDLKTALFKEFPDVVNVKEMHEAMAARKKKPDETYLQYMLAMKELGKRAKFPDYVAIQYIIDGIEDYEMNKSVLYGANNYSGLKDRLAIYESMKSKAHEQQRVKRIQIPAGNHRERERHVVMQRCFNCGSKDHMAAECKNGLKCFGCNSFGHIRKDCKVNPVPVTKRGIIHANYRYSGSGAGGGGKIKMAAIASERHGGGGSRAPTTAAMFGRSTTETENDEQRWRHLTVGSTDVTERRNELTGVKCERSIDNSTVTENVNVMQLQNVNKLCAKPVKVIKLIENNITLTCLVDTGSDVNLISEGLLFKLPGCVIVKDDLTISGLGKCKVKTIGKIFVDFEIDKQMYKQIVFHVVPHDVMPYDAILGQEFLSQVVMLVNEGSVSFLPENFGWLGKIDCFLGCSGIVLDHVRDKAIQDEVMKCVQQYTPMQTQEAPIQLKIVLKDDIPISHRPRRLSLMEQKVVEKQIEEWLEQGIIQVSFSEYSSPLVMVKKKDGSVRVCVDYRKLNEKIVKDEFPLPIIDDLIDKLQSAKVFSVLDLKNGFFHLRVSEESIPYTAFVTHQGQYEFLKAPFGLSICPKTFMRFVSIIFRNLISHGVLMIFVDDIIIPASSEKEGLQRLKRVLEVASQYGLQINWKKANLLQREIEYLGHIIKDGEVRPSIEKVEAVMKYPEPRNLKQLHSFVGLASYFRKYIKDFAIIAKPLTDLLRKSKEFLFQEEQKIAFGILKTKLTSGPVLKIFDPMLRTELHTDASSVAFAAILLQCHPDSGLHPVHYMSRKTNEAQSKYSSYELEALAIVEGVKKFRHYLHGIHFKIVTDCKAFEMTLKKKDLTAKIARWVLMLNEYDYEIEHRSGIKMGHTDALSRMPTVSVISTLNDSIKLAQAKDDGLRAIKEILHDKTYLDYSLDNDVLYKGEEKLLVVPKSLEREILNSVHSIGHFGKKKMKDLLNKDYYIRDLDKKIDEYLLSCIPCLLATKKEGKQEGFLNPIEKENVPFDTMHLDHVGPLTETRKQYNYILTVIDAFTKFVWLFPTKSTTTQETLSKMRIHQQIFGNPRRVITDRGTAFTSKEFESYCEEESICHVKITTGVPRGNGQVERIHRTILPILTKLCIDNPVVWYKHVSSVQRALNSTYQRSVNTTPFELLMGVKMRNKEVVKILNLLQEENQLQYEENRENLRIQAKEQILKIQEENRKTYDRRRKESSKYREGDIVAIKRTQFGPGLKLKPKYLGPYKVVKCKRNDRYDVEKADSSAEGPSRTSSAADQMKKWPEYNSEGLEE